jgi:quercetin dioxygenase-like cupin family protein
MICKYYRDGIKLNVADLNEITVLIDRSETELTEVALNSWWPGLDGPPHRHEQKEQIFYVISGRGTVMRLPSSPAAGSSVSCGV